MQRFLRLSVVMLAGIVFVYPLVAPMPHRVDEEHFKLICRGMTEAEVEAILGVPAGVYDWVMVFEDEYQTVAVQVPDNAIIPVQTRYDPNMKAWISRHALFYVTMNQQGRVQAAHRFMGMPVIEPPWKKWWRQLRSQVN